MENTPPASSEPAATAVAEDKTVAILSYLTLIGFIVAIVLHGSKKTNLGAFHLRQTLGLLIAGIVFGFGGVIIAMIPVLGWIAVPLIWIGFFVLWLMGLIAAATGQMKPVPVLGDKFQVWFGKTFE